MLTESENIGVPSATRLDAASCRQFARWLEARADEMEKER